MDTKRHHRTECYAKKEFSIFSKLCPLLAIICKKKRKEKTGVYLYKIYPAHCFFRNFCLYQKWLSSIGRCKKGGDHPYEDLAKSGSISEIKYKCLTILLYFWLMIKTKSMDLVIYTISCFGN
jgi:hypothetical protein